jgi:hypothetical protein
MPCAIPIGKNAAAAISNGRAPLTAQNTIEVSAACSAGRFRPVSGPPDPPTRDNRGYRAWWNSWTVFDRKAGDWLACRRMRHHAHLYVPRHRSRYRRDPRHL